MVAEALAYSRFDVRAMTPTLGAEIHGLDLREDLDERAVAEIRRALLEFKVIFFRGQKIDQERLVAFGRYFGELEHHPITPSDQPNPEVLRLVHGPEKIGMENAWHSDVTWRSSPSFASILQAIEVPAVGGDTLFCDMIAAYDGLSDPMKERVEGLRAVHDILKTFGMRMPEEQRAEMRREHPPQAHSVIRTLPETGQKLIYVNFPFTDYIEGLTREESDEILHHLYSQADLPEYQVRFHWEEGSIAFWDNRSTQHYAVSDYFPAKRVMERVTIAGEQPIHLPSSPSPRASRYGINFLWNPPPGFGKTREQDITQS